MSTLGRILLTALLVASHAIVLVAAGHGVGPVGLLLLFGEAEEYQPGQVFGWLGIVLLVLSAVHARSFRLAAPPAMLCLAVSAGAFVSVSEVWIFTAATAIPFAGAILTAGRCLGRKPRAPQMI